MLGMLDKSEVVLIVLQDRSLSCLVFVKELRLQLLSFQSNKSKSNLKIKLVSIPNDLSEMFDKINDTNRLCLKNIQNVGGSDFLIGNYLENIL